MGNSKHDYKLQEWAVHQADLTTTAARLAAGAPPLVLDHRPSPPTTTPEAPLPVAVAPRRVVVMVAAVPHRQSGASGAGTTEAHLAMADLRLVGAATRQEGTRLGAVAVEAPVVAGDGAHRHLI